ncbi:hypothetical protein GCM10023078_18530 [Gibbsiella greigii]
MQSIINNFIIVKQHSHARLDCVGASSTVVKKDKLYIFPTESMAITIIAYYIKSERQHNDSEIEFN